MGPRWIPAWAAPTPYDVYRVQQELGRTSTPRGVLPAAAAGTTPGSREERLLAADRKDFWPLGVHDNEPVVWTGDDVARLRERLPAYDIRGPGMYAICDGESGLFGAQSRLLDVRRDVAHVEDAAHMCDVLPGCTHFSVTVGPDYPFGWEPRQGMPFRADFCGGPKVTIAEVKHMNTFVGIKRTAASTTPPAEPEAEGRDLPDGAIRVSASLPVQHLGPLGALPARLQRPLHRHGEVPSGPHGQRHSECTPRFKSLLLARRLRRSRAFL
mmetsp:Transcript_33455/g.106052  ORF Transcript_33455/g.106052 Transcript_33455/m.106052 type:complete len:269 (-) Transcript_33455:32-838(-)